MSKRPAPDRTVVQQLRHLRRQVGRVTDPGDPGQFLGALESVLAGLADQVDAELTQARRTAGGAQAAVVRLSRDLRSAEDELGRLRRALVERPADEARFAVALEALTAALNHDQEYVLLADRERAARAVVAALNGMAWVA